MLTGFIAVGLAAAGLLMAPGVVGWHVYEVPTSSMERTLPMGSYIATRPVRDIERGMIVVQERPAESQNSAAQSFVKRVIAVGGDTIQCCDAAGAVTVNGKGLSEPYLFEDDRQTFGSVKVPSGRLFLMGDHRGFSADSRAFLDDRFRGTVAEQDVVGEVIGPLSRAAAHREPVRHLRPQLLALGLIVGLSTEIVRRRGRAGGRAERERVTVTDDGVTRTVNRWFQSDLDESVRWTDLESVELVSEASLRGADDVFLLLHGTDSGVVIGYNLATSTGVLARLQALPGYDHQAAVDVISSLSARQRVWPRSGMDEQG